MIKILAVLSLLIRLFCGVWLSWYIVDCKDQGWRAAALLGLLITIKSLV